MNKDFLLNKIITIVSETTQVSISDIKMEKRDRKYLFARYMFINAVIEMSCEFNTNISLTKIGNFINRHHSTIISARNEHKNLYETKFKLYNVIYDEIIRVAKEQLKQHNKPNDVFLVFNIEDTFEKSLQNVEKLTLPEQDYLKELFSYGR